MRFLAKLTLTAAMLLGVTAALFQAACLAQEPAMEQAGEEHKMLGELAGTWTAVMKPVGGAPESKGTAKYTVAGGGMWVLSELEMDMGGMKFWGHGTDGYDLKKKKFVSTWIDNMTSSVMLFEGDYDAKTKTLTMTSEAPGPDGKPTTWKSVSKMVDADHFSFDMHTKVDGKDVKMFSVEYTRKKAAAAAAAVSDK